MVARLGAAYRAASREESGRAFEKIVRVLRPSLRRVASRRVVERLDEPRGRDARAKKGEEVAEERKRGTVDWSRRRKQNNRAESSWHDERDVAAGPGQEGDREGGKERTDAAGWRMETEGERST